MSENNSNGSAPEGATPVSSTAPEAAGQPASPSASEQAEGPVLEGSALPRELEIVRAALDESQARSRITQQRLTEEHERLLRNAAEFENYKKRAQKEREDARKFGNESLLKEFLPVADNLDRALEAASSADPKQILEGVRLVQKLFEGTLGKFGVTSFSALGLPFDPAVHEAMMQLESDAPPGTVVQEMAKGYKLHERLVRPAAVVVAKARQPAAVEGDKANPDPAPDPTGDAS